MNTQLALRARTQVPTRVVDEIESVSELEELQDGVKDFVKMTMDKSFGEFWSELSIVVTAALRRLRVRQHGDERRVSADDVVRKELDAMYRDHSSGEYVVIISLFHTTQIT